MALTCVSWRDKSTCAAGLRSGAIAGPNRLGPKGPLTSLLSMWKSNAVRPVESGVVT